VRPVITTTGAPSTDANRMTHSYVRRFAHEGRGHESLNRSV
jgi:hypothetical protein